MNISKAISSAAAVVGSVLCVSAASAADLPMYTKAAPVVAPVVNWTGLYIGGNVGGEWGRFNDPLAVGGVTAGGITAIPETIPSNSDNSSFTGGGQIGYRWQLPTNWVVGVEGDFNWVELKNTQTLAIGQFPPGNITLVPGDMHSVKTNWESSIRGNIGYAWGSVLAYVTGGVAFANVQASSNFIATPSGGFLFPASGGSQTKTLTGGTVGVGIAYSLTKNWDIGAEYRYTKYDGSDFAIGTVAAIGGPGGVFFFVPATSHVDLSTNEIRFRADYRFDWAGPAATRY
jgi:outer membrane immunogenic protein